MGKTKGQVKEKEKKFDRNVEISAPILDPEIIKAIHTPPKGQALNIKHGGFKALLSDLNSQDSTDELMPLNDDHVPSYIGISCAVSGYSNYSPYIKKPSATNASSETQQQITSAENSSLNTTARIVTPNRSRATSPVLRKTEPQICHITIDKNNINSVDDERRELTEKLTASAIERNRQSPIPCVPPTEDDRHHGAYVGARYCPLPTLSKAVNKHIPLLGIDDELDEEKALEEEQKENKVEHKIATLYGDKMVKDWKESMTHKVKKELTEEQQQILKSPKDLVNLKPAPAKVDEIFQHPSKEFDAHQQDDTVNVPNVKVLANVEKQFLNKLLSDENPPFPSSHSPAKLAKPSTSNDVEVKIANKDTNLSKLETAVDEKKLVELKQEVVEELASTVNHSQIESVTEKKIETDIQSQSSPLASPAQSPVPSPPSPSMLPESGENHLLAEESLIIPPAQAGEEHIEYEIRAQSPIDNQSSPLRFTASSHEDQLMKINREIRLGESTDEDSVNSVQIHDTAATTTNTNTNTGKEEGDEEKLIITLHSLESSSSLVKCELNETINNCNEDDGLQKDEHQNQLTPTEASNEVNFSVDSDSKDGHYYLKLLEVEKIFILREITQAEEQLKIAVATNMNDEDDETRGKVRSAIGKATLLINKKFNQFRELCAANINKNSEEQFATLNDDLAGFWDMLNLQIVDVRKSFEMLRQLEEKEEAGEEQYLEQLVSSDDFCSQADSGSSCGNSKGATTKANSKSKLSAQKDKERRERLQEHIQQMKKNQTTLS